MRWFQNVARKNQKIWKNPLWAAAFLNLIFLFAAVSARVGSAIEISGDESGELAKGLLWCKRFSLYHQIWNDQPPLYTVMMGALFKCFGPTIAVARSLAVCFGLLLINGCFILVKKRSGILAAFAATLCLLAFHPVFTLSVSTMLEVPAIAVALWALWPIHRWAKDRRWIWLAMSGLVFSIALQIKMTAAVAIPALMVEIALSSGRTRWSETIKATICSLSFWGGCGALGFLVWGEATGVDYRQAWLSHSSGGTDKILGLPPFGPSLTFSPWNLPWHIKGYILAAGGLLAVVLPRDWRRLAFPLVFLLTVTVVHTVHHPFWGYYYLHFALPIAWLLGYGVSKCFQLVWGRPLAFSGGFVLSGRLIVTWILVTVVFGCCEMRLFQDILRIRNLPQLENNALVGEMVKYRTRTKWVFAGAWTYSFHAKLPTIPELSVLPLKRFWSGQITEKQMWDIVKKYQPEQVLWGKHLPSEAQEFISKNYTKVYEDNENGEAHCLYVLNALVGVENRDAALEPFAPHLNGREP